MKWVYFFLSQTTNSDMKPAWDFTSNVSILEMLGKITHCEHIYYTAYVGASSPLHK